MEQTALNLIAIGIFAITLSSLLGPVLNISPVIPTLTTLGIMGLATLDNLTWGGKGTTLLLDRFSSPQERQRVLHHEAGHFLVACFLDIPVTDYTLNAWEAFKKGQPGLGGVIVDTAILEKTINIQETPLIVERLCTVWMAGIAAENLVYGNAQGGESDRAIIKEILRLAGFSANTYLQKERWALLQAKNLLEKHHNAYEALVKVMEKRASVEDCFQAIRQHS
jgi:hypothetical protein